MSMAAFSAAMASVVGCKNNERSVTSTSTSTLTSPGVDQNNVRGDDDDVMAASKSVCDRVATPVDASDDAAQRLTPVGEVPDDESVNNGNNERRVSYTIEGLLGDVMGRNKKRKRTTDSGKESDCYSIC